jgi:hypothetical protein
MAGITKPLLDSGLFGPLMTGSPDALFVVSKKIKLCNTSWWLLFSIEKIGSMCCRWWGCTNVHRKRSDGVFLGMVMSNGIKKREKKKVPKQHRLGFNSLITLVAWWLWKHRNSCVSDGTSPNAPRIIRDIKDDARMRCTTGAKGLSSLWP